MKIKDCVYKGFKYEIHFEDKGDWGPYIHHFHTKSNHTFDGGFEKTIDKVIENIQKQIDCFMQQLPKTMDELLDCIESNCFIWTGYESCELDRETTALLITSFLNNKSNEI